MKKIARINIDNKNYQIDLNKFYDLSIPINTNKKNPQFYDEKPIKISYYKDQNNKVWNIRKGASCNVPIINLNIHCGSTHSECRSHITKEDLYISEVIKDFFIPCALISVRPKRDIGKDTYHHRIDSSDLIITKKMLKDKLNIFKAYNIKALILRTLPNGNDIGANKDYNQKNPFFSNESIKYLKSLGIKHLVVDLPSIDRLDDGGSLGNHKIFWDLKEEGNDNTITEFAIIKNQIEDDFYLLSLNILNMNLDASPSRPLIYPILK